MLIFPEENNTGLRPVPSHQYSPLHTLKVTYISAKLNRMQCNTKWFFWWKENVDLKSFVVWVKRMSICITLSAVLWRSSELLSDMLVIKIIILIQSFVQRHFLQGSRSKALYSTNSIPQSEKIALYKATKVWCTSAGTCAKLVTQVAITIISIICPNCG